MMTKIDSTQLPAFNQALADFFQVKTQLIEPMTADHSISAREIWNQLPFLQAPGQCHQNLACRFAAESYFIPTMDSVLSQLAGVDGVIDFHDDCSVVKMNQFYDVESTQLPSLTRRMNQLKDEWPAGSLPDDQLTLLQSQKSTQLKKSHDVHVIVAKVRDGTQDDGPSAVRTLAFLPSEGDIHVSRQTAIDFLITQINNFPNVTSLYQSIDVRGEHNAQVDQGKFETTNTMVMQNLGITNATATFDTDIYWYKEPGDDQAATIYFDFKPQNAVSGIVMVKAFTGKFIIRPARDNQGREGLLFELYVYFDIDVPGFLKGIKNEMVSWLMGDRMKTFCQEIGYQYLASLH